MTGPIKVHSYRVDISSREKKTFTRVYNSKKVTLSQIKSLVYKPNFTVTFNKDKTSIVKPSIICASSSWLFLLNQIIVTEAFPLNFLPKIFGLY